MARTLIDTLGAIALSAVDTPSPPPSSQEETRRHIRTSNSSSSRGTSASARDETPGGGTSASTSTSAGVEAFGLAVDELAAMCGGEDGRGTGTGNGTEGAGNVQGWVLLGLPLR